MSPHEINDWRIGKLLLRLGKPRSIVVIAEAFFDESGTHDGAESQCVAGYIIKGEDSALMESEWLSVLDDYKLPFFHMKEAAHLTKKFKNFDKATATIVARKMINIIKRRTVCGFAFVLNPNKFDLPQSVKAGSIVNYHAFCVYSIVQGVRGYIQEHSLGDELKLVLEAGAPDQPSARNVIAEIAKGIGDSDGTGNPRIVSYEFEDKDTGSCALQAADILAWQVCRYIRGVLEGRKARLDFQSLLEHPHQIIHISNMTADGRGDPNAYSPYADSEACVRVIIDANGNENPQ